MSRNAVLFLLPLLCALLLCAPASASRHPRRRTITTAALRQKLAAVHGGHDQRTSDIVDLQKTIYSVLGQYEIPEIVSRFKPEFKRLDVDGTLANTLDALYEMRLLDMQISIQHAKKMRGVLNELGKEVV